MKLCELYSIEAEYEASGSICLLGRTAPGSSLKKFILVRDPLLPRQLWPLIEKTKYPRQNQQYPMADYYLKYLNQLLRS